MAKPVTIALLLSLFALMVAGCGEELPVAGSAEDAAEIVGVDGPAAGQPAGGSLCGELDSPALPTERSTEAWVAELRKGMTIELVDAGEEAAPIFLAAIQDPEAAAAVVSMLGLREKKESWMIPVLVAGLDSTDANTRYCAVMELGEFGPRVRNVVPTIAKDLEPLCKSDGDAVLDLIEKIELPVEEASVLLSKLHAAGSSFSSGPGAAMFGKDKIIAKIIGNGPQGVPALLDLVANMELSDERDFSLPRCNGDVIDALAAGLNDRDVKRRRAAAWLLAHASAQNPGGFTEQQLAAVVLRLENEDEFVRLYLYGVLEQQPPRTAEAATALLAKLRDANRSEVHLAARALAKAAPQSLEALRVAAQSEYPPIRLAATVALGSLKALGDEDISLLIRMTVDADVTIRQYAIYGLQNSRRGTPEVVQCFTAAIKDPETCFWAYRALGEIGPAAASALPLLVERLPETEPSYRVYLAQAIWKIEPRSPVVFPTILEVLKDTKTPRSGYTCITKIVDGKRIEVRGPLREPVAYTAAQALGEMGLAAAPAVPALVEALDSDNADLAGAAVRALGKIGPAAQAAIDPLRKLVSSDDPRNADALYSLRQIAPDVAAKMSTPHHRTQVFPLAPERPLD